MSLSMYWPIALIVLSNIAYHICAKSTPSQVNPFVCLTATYLVGAVIAALLSVVFQRTGSVMQEVRRLNWTSLVMGFSIVGLEIGAIYLYKVGWDISTGELLYSALLAICLLLIGVLFYHESVSFSKIAGIALCMVGIFFINR